MKLVIGLGNPGPDYASTRHNIGFMVADEQAKAFKQDWKLWGQGKRSEMVQSGTGDDKVILLKPLTFMNLSGHAAVEAAHFFKILPEDICAIHDEMDLPFGDVRLKSGGGPGGHNGLKSLTESLASDAYARIRMGIGRPPGVVPGHDYVLSPFGSGEWTVVEDMVQRALRGIAAFLAGPREFNREMSLLNKRAKKVEE